MIMRMKIKIISLTLCILLLVTVFPVSKAIKTNCSINHIDDDSPRIYFVIGIGMYIDEGTWPYYNEIWPIFLIRFGKTGLHILGPKCGERIDFVEGDKFIGYYPFLIGIGFVCGIWIDI